MVQARPRSFVDTNVFFSGLHGSGGPPSRILQLHAEGRIQIVISRQVLMELVSALRSKLPQALPALQDFLTSAPPEICSDPTPEETQPARSWINTTDAPILAAALKSGADCLVTGNTRHFTPRVAERARIRILAPPEYVETLPQEHV